MKISVATLIHRSQQLERELDLQLADLCFKAPKLFTQSHILPNRNAVAKRSFDRLVAVGVLEDHGKKRMGLAKATQYSINHERYLELQNESPKRPSSAPRPCGSSTFRDGV
jgi:hypothetical protein